MPTDSKHAQLTATIDIAAPPTRVWHLVSDVRRTGERSPECTRVVPLGPIRSRTLLIGVNRRGRMRWVTLSRLTRVVADTYIEWRVMTNGAVWSYAITPTEAGCRLEQTRDIPDGLNKVAGWFTRRFLDGEAAHDEELVAGMRQGLQQIKSSVERA